MSNNNVFMMKNAYTPDDPRSIYSAKSLTNIGYHVTLIGAARQRDGFVDSYQRIEGVDVVITPMIRTLNPIHLLTELWDILRGKIKASVFASSRNRTTLLSFVFFNLWVLRLGLLEEVGIIHCHDLSPLPASWLLSRIKRVPLIYDAHENVPTMYSGRKGRLLSWLERRLIPKADIVISAGKRMADIMPARGARRVSYIGNWKRLADYSISGEEIRDLRDKFGINDEDIVITYIGTIDPTREITTLLDAVKKSPNVKLIIGGRGLLVDEVLAAARENKNIHWLGWIDIGDVPLYTCASDALYCCLDVKRFQDENYFAPAANKLYEAMAAGIPIIARRGVNEMGDILQELDTGILLEEVTPETVGRAFARLRDPDFRASLRNKALIAREDNHWGIAEEKLKQVYEMILIKT